MNAPVLWVILPLGVSIILFALGSWKKTSFIIAVSSSLLFTVLTSVIPIGTPLHIGSMNITITDSFPFLGRQFILTTNDLPILALVYGSLAFWLGAASIADTPKAFLPVGMMMAAFLTAILAVEPKLYAAIFIELVTLVSVLLLVMSGRTVGRGSIRFLVFQTLSMPLILYGGFILGQIESSQPQVELLSRATISFGLGFVLLMGIFPFHTWLPLIMEEANPYVASFLIYMFTLVNSIFINTLINRYEWLQASPEVHIIIATIGLIMILFGGISAVFQTHLGRIFASFALSEIGYTLITIGMPIEIGGSLFFALIIPRALSMAVWALGLAIIKNNYQSLNFTDLRGIFRHSPFAVSGLIIAQLSALGFPLLAGFPPRLPLWATIVEENLWIALILSIGTLGLFVSTARVALILFVGNSPAIPHNPENKIARWFTVVGILGILLLGIMPQIITPFVVRLLRMFQIMMP
ncbi:MAG: proton-conducting transporter membrane subunit [Chloroflexota bacterium]